MSWIRRGVTAAAVTAGAAAAARRVWSRRARVADHWPTGGRGREPRDGWHSVTVNRPMDQVAPDGRLPEPLSRLAKTAEVRIRPAPADRGTELAVRLHGREQSGMGALVGRLRGRDGHYPVRSALRETKQLVETGEVLSPHRPPTTKPTLRNRPMQVMIRRAREEGRL